MESSVLLSLSASCYICNSSDSVLMMEHYINIFCMGSLYLHKIKIMVLYKYYLSIYEESLNAFH